MKRLYIGFLFAVAALAAALFMPINSYAADYTRGEVLAHGLSVCMKKADAIELVVTEKEKGLEAAGALFQAKAECANLPVFGLTVGKTVYTDKVTRNGVLETMSVVEILNAEGEVSAYFITTGSIGEPAKGVDGKPLNLKPTNNA